MSGILLATQSAVKVPPAPEPPKWRSAQHTWTGWNGSVWDLSEGTGGVRLLAGVRGMHAPALLPYTTSSPAVPGSFYTGYNADPRDVFWPIKVWQSANSQAWIEHNRRWWSTLDPGQTGLWSVIQPDGHRRSLRLRFVSETDDADDTSPELVGWKYYFLNLIADQPYWEGEPETQSFTNDTDEQDYYGGDAGGGFGPPYYISRGSTLTTATVNNIGEVPAYPIWKLRGPCTTATVGLNGHLIDFPIALDAGEWIEFDTAPTSLVALDQDGNDRSAEMTGDVDFWPIPPGQAVPLSLTMTGTGGVEITVVPKYFRAM